MERDNKAAVLLTAVFRVSLLQCFIAAEKWRASLEETWNTSWSSSPEFESTTSRHESLRRVIPKLFRWAFSAALKFSLFYIKLLESNKVWTISSPLSFSSNESKFDLSNLINQTLLHTLLHQIFSVALFNPSSNCCTAVNTTDDTQDLSEDRPRPQTSCDIIHSKRKQIPQREKDRKSQRKAGKTVR